MQRDGTIKRKKSLADYCKAKREKLEQYKDKGPKPKPVLRRQSKAREREMRLYYQESIEWLKLPKNAACAICLCLGQTPMAATEVHHLNGRIGRLLRYQPFWIPSCRQCRDIPHTRVGWAREMGLLGKPSEWNVYPKDA